MRNIEHRTQSACVNWFRYVYDDALIFAIPNGGRRDSATGAFLKAEGVVAGVADLEVISSAGIMFIEMKTMTGRQSAPQRDFQRKVESMGYRYSVCHSFDDFREAVEGFLGKR